LREINEAYEYLMKSRAGAGRPQAGEYSGESGSGYGDAYRAGPEFARVRQFIDRGDLDQAEALLRGLNSRDPEWMFLKGVISLRKGWYEQAYQLFRQAAAAAPGNLRAVEQMEAANRGFQTASWGRRSGQGPDPCAVCTTLWCADCLCESCGGDLVPCC